MQLTEAQTLAVQSKGDTIVIASAGTGKSSVLTQRILYALSNNMPPAAILAFTFTEKAAAEMRARITKELKTDPGLAMRLDISTIHAYCRKLLSEHGRRLGLKPEFKILNDTAMQAWLRQNAEAISAQALFNSDPAWQTLLAAYGYRRLSAIVPKLCEALPDSKAVRHLLPDETLPAELRIAWEAVFKQTQLAGETALQKRIKVGALSFNDLIQLTIRLLESHADILSEIQKNLSLLLVDECQDMSPDDIRLINCLHAPKRNHLFAVGDPKQSIYAFRQADAKLFETLKARVLTAGGQAIALDATFRTPQNLQEQYNAVFQRLFKNDVGLFVPLHSPLSELSGHVYCLTEENLFTPAIITRIKELQANGWPLKNLAVLCFKKKPLFDIAESLRDAGIATQMGENPLALASPLVRTTLHILAQLAGLKDTLIAYGINALPTITPDWLTAQLPIWEKLKTSVYADELANIIANDLGGPANELDQAALFALSNLLSERIDDEPPYLDQALPILRALYGNFTLTADLHGDEAQAVHLLTIHKAKGLEFAHVFIIPSGRGRNDTDIIRNVAGTDYVAAAFDQTSTALKTEVIATALMQSAKDVSTALAAAEARRLFYVALTRTFGDVHVCAPPATKELEKIFAKGADAIAHCPTFDKLLTWLSRQPECRSWDSFAAAPQAQEQANAHATQVAMRRPQQTTPLRISVTQLEAFHLCPARYRLQYLQGLIPLAELNPNFEEADEETLDAVTRGSFIHEILEFYDFATGVNRDTVTTQALQNQHLTDADGHLRRLGETIITGLSQNPELKPYFADANAKKEIAFTLKFKHFLLEGKIDRLNLNPPTIIDYKTHSKPPAGGWAKLAARYDFQMGCYALAVAEASGSTAVDTIILFTTGPQVIRKSLNQKFLTELKNDLNALYDRLDLAHRSGVFPITSDRLLCKRCPFFAGGACGVKNAH